jgi:hypothetical protein
MLVLGMVGSVSALTGSIGNGRMTFKDLQTGDVLEKTILVRNINDVSVDIDLSPSGDLADDVTIIDKEFRLGPGEEKRAEFKIKVTKEGVSETKIDVRFTPVDGGNGVGLSSKITLEAEKGPGFFGSLFGGGDDNDDSGDNAGVTGDVVGVEDKNMKLLKVGLTITAIIFLVFVVLLYLASKKKREGVDGGEGSERMVVKKENGVKVRKDGDVIKPKKSIKK